MRAQATFTTFILLALNLLPSLALPTDPGHRNAITHLAHDEENDLILAYRRDGLLVDTYPAEEAGVDWGLGKRAAGSCSSVTLEELKQLPDYKLIEQYADKNFGTGSRNVVVNPKEYADRPAQSCVDGSVSFAYTGDPKCTTQSSESSGSLVGTSGSVSIKTIQGFQSKASFTTTQSSKLSTSAHFSASAGFAKIAEVSADFSFSSEFFNSNTQVTSSNINNQNEISIEMKAAQGKQCKISNTVKSCTVQAKGALKLKATGYVWFNYNDKQKGHFKWAAHMDEILNDAQRTSPMQLTGDVQAETKSAFAGKCV
ncbi:hypothetical protein V5O48_010989 [Marasmius crinis-equi]|uniref:Uncharacterized protein n=1 Tax=Marasmius crinis-equi TaxID=585013 RepID=A0ABR3F6W2_9AGAR